MEPGQTVYKAYVSDSVCERKGVYWTIYSGTVSDRYHDDEPLIDRGSPYLEKADNSWRDTRNEALLDAASRIDAIRKATTTKLFEQADEIRTKVRNSEEAVV